MYRCKQWQTWHEGSVNLNGIRSIENQYLQAECIIQYTTLQNNNNYSIIEIGPADGGTCYELLSKNSNITSYTLVDDISMLNICKERLKQFNVVNYVEINDILTLKNIKFNLLISNHCLEETPKNYQQLVYDTFFPNTKEVFILCNTVHSNMWGEFDAFHLESNMKKFYNVYVYDGHRLSRNTQKIYYGK